ncbi:MAG: hypothetical protein WBO55_09180, partial [Rhizobiaceae bacterium]
EGAGLAEHPADRALDDVDTQRPQSGHGVWRQRLRVVEHHREGVGELVEQAGLVNRCGLSVVTWWVGTE